MERIQYIDKLKGLAILFVVIGHVAEFSLGISNTIFNESYISFHMPLFMFLSGIFAYKNFKSPKAFNAKSFIEFLKNKIARLIIPFVSMGVIYSIISTGKPLGAILGQVGRLWFLPTLFYCMILGLVWIYFCNLFSKLCNVSKQNHLSCVFGSGGELLILIILYALCVFLYLSGIRFPYLLHLLKFFPYFFLGVMYSRYPIVNSLVNKSNTLYSISIVLFVFFLIAQWKELLPQFFLYTGVFSIIILIQFFDTNDKNIPNILKKIGEYSLEIYLFHWLFLPDLQTVRMFENLIGQTVLDANYIVYLLISLFIAIPIIFISILISLFIKQSKFLNFILLGAYKKS